MHAQIRPPPDEQHLPLSFEFPEGDLIGIAKEKLPVTVTFTGTRPTSFTANVVFLDEDGKRFSLPITGTTDASVLTVKSFLEVRLHVLSQKSNSFEWEFARETRLWPLVSLFVWSVKPLEGGEMSFFLLKRMVFKRVAMAGCCVTCYKHASCAVATCTAAMCLARGFWLRLPRAAVHTL